MSFLQEANQILDAIFDKIQRSQNDRIIKNVKGLNEEIKKNISELDEKEADLNIKLIYLKKLLKLYSFAENPNNLKQVWKYFQFNIYSQQDQFMELIQNLPQLIQQHLQQKILTFSSFINQSITELFPHQLVSFKIKLQEEEQNLQENADQEDCVGCITYVSPEVQNEKIFRITMKLKEFISKVKKLDQLIVEGNLDAEILKLTLDNQKKQITLWSRDDQISYQITRKLTLDDVPQFEQKIYLQQNMVIQLTQKFQLFVKACSYGNKKSEEINQNFTPFLTGLEKNKIIKPILNKENQNWIVINNGFEDVIYYPNQIPLKISQYQTLPKGIEVILENDGAGHYIAVVGNCSSFWPRIKCKQKGDQLLQFITKQDNFNLGIIYQNNFRLLLNSDLISVWNGSGLFDL
ncbi:unnamed protein product [Paramecium sonneborni]|uniref:Uncharacterized protein n=1 Tax=Paramecium sonneborni TaxID=65129 RepID=A0A8S1RFU2_9CILI|nr:unnamed protein product [Paramecium sonneborni]